MAAEREGEGQLVVIGASAGGVEALSTLVATLPPDFATPIVIAQHLDPRRLSHLGEILQRRSPLPVRTVQDHEPLENGVVYVVPANRDIEVTDHSVAVRAADGGPQPSVDRLLRTAAAVFGERLIAVILTGTGSDGAAGARAVKEAGGTVVIQNPQTASYPAMPLSLAPTTVDLVAELEAIGPLLQELAATERRPVAPADERSLRRLLEDLRDRSGIDFTAYKPATIQRRLQRRMAATGAETVAAYVRLLQRDPEEYQRLVASFLIKVTEFFRDPELYEYLRERALPGLIEDTRRRSGELRVWSAGCATGEEAYSLAILLCEMLGDEVERLGVRIFATDLDPGAVTFARRGIYPAQALADLPPELVERYFSRSDGEYEVTKRVRSLLIFGQHDLGQRAPFPRLDLALCRNVLIYFTTELQRRALQLFAFSLRDGGVLVLGKSETTGPLAEHFVLEQPQLKVYRRRGDPVLMPTSRIRDVTPLRPLQLVPGRQAPTPVELALLRGPREVQRVRTTADRADEVLAALPVGVVVVDRRYDIRSINGAARRLLEIHGEAIGEDLIHLAGEGPSQALRAAIDAAFAATPGETLERTIAVETAGGETRHLSVACRQRPVQPTGDGSGYVTVALGDVTAAVVERAKLDGERVRLADELARQRAINERLTETNRRVLAANEELAAANADLRSANEEFLVANEEVQAAIEEAETLNEELQATNEELETLNEELQATVEELNTTNDELQARTAELQELAASLEAQRTVAEEERTAMLGILASMSDALLVVDAEGRPVQTNAAYDALVGGPEGALRPEDDEGRPLPEGALPQRRTARGESFTMAFTLPAPHGRRRYEAIGRPLAGKAGRGGVVLIRAIGDDGGGQ